MKRPKLSILICGLHERVNQLSEILSILNLNRYIETVEILTLIDSRNSDTTSGQKRNRLLEMSRGRYVVFIDDDDLITDDYLSCIFDQINHGYDIASITATVYGQGDTKDHFFALGNKDGVQLSRSRIGMEANHLCARKREHAMLLPFPCWCGYNDDVLWYTPVNMICRDVLSVEDSGLSFYNVTYTYKWDPQHTANQTPESIAMTKRLASEGLVVWESNGTYMRQLPMRPGFAECFINGRYSQIEVPSSAKIFCKVYPK